MSKAGIEGTSRKHPYAGPVWSSGTKEMDSKNNQGSVAGPGVDKISPPDPLGLHVNKNKGGK